LKRDEQKTTGCIKEKVSETHVQGVGIDKGRKENIIDERQQNATQHSR